MSTSAARLRRIGWATALVLFGCEAASARQPDEDVLASSGTSEIDLDENPSDHAGLIGASIRATLDDPRWGTPWFGRGELCGFLLARDGEISNFVYGRTMSGSCGTSDGDVSLANGSSKPTYGELVPSGHHVIAQFHSHPGPGLVPPGGGDAAVYISLHANYGWDTFYVAPHADLDTLYEVRVTDVQPYDAAQLERLRGCIDARAWALFETGHRRDAESMYLQAQQEYAAETGLSIRVSRDGGATFTTPDAQPIAELPAPPCLSAARS